MWDRRMGLAVSRRACIPSHIARSIDRPWPTNAAGLIEAIPDAVSLDTLKKKSACATLLDYFIKVYAAHPMFV
jgi:hypothetical protein